MGSRVLESSHGYSIIHKCGLVKNRGFDTMKIFMEEKELNFIDFFVYKTLVQG